jgi:rRNA-processing protein FCF1
LVLLDTNVLLLVIRTRFPLETEVERLNPGAVLAVPASVLGELDRLSRELTPGAAAARALADRYARVATPERGDEGVADAARRVNAWVATADKALRDQLIRDGVTVLHPRDRQRLERASGHPRRSSNPPPARGSRRPRGNS